MTIEIDRSRIIAMQSCPRQRYLAYHHLGTGIQRRAKALPLQFGSAFHEGCEVLLNDWQGNPEPEKIIETAVLRARLYLSNAFAEGEIGFDGEQPPDLAKAIEYGKEEQGALAEALLRAWWAFEGPSFLEQFEVVEVEREERATLAKNYDDYDTGDLVLMFRPDALLRDRESGDLYVLSWKTCASFGQRTVDQARHDMQSMSEVWGWMNSVSCAEIHSEEPTKSTHIEGTLYKWIVKGRRSLDKYDSLYKQQTHLIYGWMKPGPTPEETDWSWAYEFEREDGTGNTRLGKGWRKVPIWRDYPGGVKAWIDDLHNNRVNPRHVDALAAVFPQSLPVERRADEIEHWRNQVVAQETQVARNVDIVNDYSTECPQLFPERLDELFPQYTHSCHSFSGCPFLDVCWNGVAAEVGEKYQARVSNHPEAKEESE